MKSVGSAGFAADYGKSDRLLGAAILCIAVVRSCDQGTRFLQHALGALLQDLADGALRMLAHWCVQ